MQIEVKVIKSSQQGLLLILDVYKPKTKQLLIILNSTCLGTITEKPNSRSLGAADIRL